MSISIYLYLWICNSIPISISISIPIIYLPPLPWDTTVEKMDKIPTFTNLISH